MPTLDELMVRSKKSDLGSFVADELYRLGYRSDKPAALKAFAEAGRGGKEEERAVEDAVADYQRTWKIDLDSLAARTYGRAMVVDGDPGPVTLQHIFNRTCGVPDRFYAADGTLKKAEARWPDSCLNDVRIRLNESSYGSSMGLTFAQFCAAYDRALAHIMSFGKIGLKRVTGDARVTVDFENLGGSTLAWSHLANNDCGSKQQRYTRRTWTDSYAFLVIVHECLHLCGCPHTPGNYIMNPSIITSLTGMTDRDVQNLLSQGYAKADPPTDPDPDPDPDPTPDEWPVGWRVRGELTNGETIDVSDLKKIDVRFNDGKKTRALISIGY